MSSVINKYLILAFCRIIFNTVLIFLSLGILLNLFEEIEFFKNLNLPFSLPVILSLSYVPTLMMELLPFIIFLSSMFYFLHLKSSKDLLSIKVFGYSNIRIILILSFFFFFFGVFVLLAVNPVTSTLVRYYETEKAQYAKDVGHLIAVNKNGVWIKEVDDFGYKIINAEILDEDTLKQISIFIFNDNHELIKRLESESAIITNSPWQMKNVYRFNFKLDETTFFENYEHVTKNVSDKINSLSYEQLNKKGYSKNLLNEKFNKFISLPVFLFLMVVLAAVFTIGSLRSKQNFYYILISILICVAMYYFKDLSIALGQTEKISLILSVWMPIIVIALFCSIGVIQINEK